MTIDEKWAKAMAKLYVECVLSKENDRIKNPIRNDNKYETLTETIVKVCEFAGTYKGTVNIDDPDFPCDCHLVELILPTENDEIVVREIKSHLADAINAADEVNIDTDLKGNLRIHFGFENVYTEREV